MAHDLVCWKCGAALAELSLPLRRLDECPRCHAELHVCRMCVDYDTSVAKHPGLSCAAMDKARAELEKLFGKR
ncbi:MAG: hypothetical protein E6K29_19320 [Gammaproteobacteria bacterium]|nr:MAG: hypothetical protein E6K29_19320 [Gammaproteobacteria bacterium]